LWTGGMMYKLKNKQLIHLTKGKYHDGGELDISILSFGIRIKLLGLKG